jgi:two-component system, OmpR family, osmolarity sensor histidine kinase EnvZ
MSLFARSFLLIALLVVTSLSVSLAILRAYQREPLAAELSRQTGSIVNLTRAALINADPERRLGLLRELSDMEDIRVYAAAPGEALEPMPREPLLDRVVELVRGMLGERTRFAWSRDGVEGFWVSFFIEEDEYWIALPRERVKPDETSEWIGWGALTLLLSLLAAWLIASRIVGPLSALARAAQLVGSGVTPEPLAEKGPRELRTVAAAFNRMTSGLASMERERTIVLAGISHDLRTPLSRLRLALEMSGSEESILRGMSADIDEMDQVIGQFLDFARGEDEKHETVDLDDLVRDVVDHYSRLGRNVTRVGTPAAGACRLRRLSVHRAIMNLVDNALRHAGEPVQIAVHRSTDHVQIEVLDRGPGIPPEEAERLKRPFTRLSESRSGSGGAGLGLAIVERIARGHGGSLDLLPRDGGGLVVRLALGLRSKN